jgi:hypothetical protein
LGREREVEGKRKTESLGFEINFSFSLI